MREAFYWAVLLSVPACAAGEEAKVPDTGVAFDLQGLIDKEVKAGSRKIVVPPGRYRVTPKRQQHLVLKDLQDIEIVADGVEMVCTETTRALTVSNCRNVTVRGLAIDYDPLPFTQGRIVKLSDDRKIHEVELFEGYPPAEMARTFKYEIFKPDTRTLRCEDHYPKKVEVIDPRHIRIINAGGSAKDAEQAGDLIVIGAEYTPHGNAGHAVECSGNVNVRLENIDLYASNCFGFLEYNCDGSTYQRCRIDRRPPESDPVKRADPRLRSLNADAFHSKHAVKGPAYIECVARFMGDDAVNICGDYHMVTACNGAELRVLAKGSMNIAAGDQVELFAYDGKRLPDAKLAKAERDGKITDAEKAFLLKQRMDEGIRTKWNADAYKVTLDRAVELPMGSLIASARRMGNGFVVQGCDFGFNRSRGILIKASDGKVVGNKLTGNWGPAILVSPEYWWLESGSSNNVEIRDNTISGCRARPILVHAQGGQGLISGKLAPAGAHNNIAILNNTISDCPLPNIEVTSTEGLRIEGNTFRTPKGVKPDQDPATIEAVKTVNCAQVTTDGNAVK
ncbi:MAG: right-handed parallel beta-helix repeat-containing protein [Planctomycetota bacterium]|nr:right-handed parallel beta-helix repeat-containing protein [Planctomycetota bacterium]